VKKRCGGGEPYLNEKAGEAETRTRPDGLWGGGGGLRESSQKGALDFA